MPTTDEPTEQRPVYQAFPIEDGSATKFWGVSCNEGWRSSIVCTGMYEWAADWLVEQLQGKPFAPEAR